LQHCLAVACPPWGNVHRVDVDPEVTVTRRDLSPIKEQLLRERRELISRALKAMREDTTFDSDDLPDEIDQASAEYIQGLSLRLRDREGYYLRKIDEALRKMESGVYGICEICQQEIPLARLIVRPVAPLCISCKESQERLERTYGL
jgi:DnaK suppressor protein